MPNPTTTTARPDGVAVLARVAELLDAAARELWARAQTEGPLGASYFTAQDLHLNADLAASLLPEDVASDRPPVEPLTGSQDLHATMTEAHTLLSSVPIEVLPAGASQLLVRLADLIRQVRS